MPIIETAIAKCDVCGKEEAAVMNRSVVAACLETMGWTRLVRGADDMAPKLICPAHAIQVTHNGDVVTLVPQDGESP